MQRRIATHPLVTTLSLFHDPRSLFPFYTNSTLPDLAALTAAPNTPCAPKKEGGGDEIGHGAGNVSAMPWKRFFNRMRRSTGPVASSCAPPCPDCPDLSRPVQTCPDSLCIAAIIKAYSQTQLSRRQPTPLHTGRRDQSLLPSRCPPSRSPRSSR